MSHRVYACLYMRACAHAYMRIGDCAHFNAIFSGSFINSIIVDSSVVNEQTSSVFFLYNRSIGRG